MLYSILQRHGQKELLVLEKVECHSRDILADSLFPFLLSNTHNEWKSLQINPNSFSLLSFFPLFTHSPLHTAHTNFVFQSRVQLFKTSCSHWSVAFDTLRLLWMNVWHGSETAEDSNVKPLTQPDSHPPSRTEGENTMQKFMAGDEERKIYCHGWNRLYMGKINLIYRLFK